MRIPPNKPPTSKAANHSELKKNAPPLQKAIYETLSQLTKTLRREKAKLLQTQRKASQANFSKEDKKRWEELKKKSLPPKSR